MHFDLTDDQKAIAHSVAALLEKGLPEAELVARFDRQTLDEPLWHAFASLEAGGVLVPPELGGLGLDLLTLAQVAELMGRHGASLPAVTNALAAWAIADAGTHEQRAKWLQPLISGKAIAAFALAEPEGRDIPEDWQLAGPLLHGRKVAVEWGANADLLLVGVSGGVLALVDAHAQTVARRVVVTVDGSQPSAEVTFDGTKAEPLGDEALAERLRDALLVMQACDALGAASRALHMAVEYAKVRTQFDRPIGSFQAMKHQMANLAAELEPCRPLCWYAAHAWDVLPDKRAYAAAAAKAHVTDIAVRTGRMAVELHGGIGYTWEYPLHIFLKRAMRNRTAFGSPARHRARVAQLAAW
jgi:alkylation response protein AidB-like acyl-CoA dehydrogenase